jgi:hypothetical protein
VTRSRKHKPQGRSNHRLHITGLLYHLYANTAIWLTIARRLTDCTLSAVFVANLLQKNHSVQVSRNLGGYATTTVKITKTPETPGTPEAAPSLLVKS